MMKGHTGWDLVKDGLIGAATGALFGGVFSVLGQGIGAGIGGLVSGGLRSAAGMAGKAIGKEFGDIVGGRITGGFVGGMLRGGAAKAAGGGIRGGGRSAEPGPGRPAGRGDGGGRSCPVHSFDPSTRVLMADGSTRPIKDVGVGDKVAATDPKTRTTAAKPVTMLHVNRDTELTDVTVTSSRGGGRGATATLKTTRHHPFWDVTAAAWVLASALVVGHAVLASDGSTETVVAVRNHAGAQNMRDLTVADTHTYYVVAGTTPVLVHNCGEARFEVDSAGVATDKASTGRVGVIGTREDTLAAKGWAGHEVLDDPQWSLEFNDGWVQSVITREMDVYVGSPMNYRTLWDPINMREKVFARELRMFQDAMYTWDGYTLISPK